LRPAAIGVSAFAGFANLRVFIVADIPAVDGVPAGDGFHRFLLSLLQRSVAAGLSDIINILAVASAFAVTNCCRSWRSAAACFISIAFCCFLPFYVFVLFLLWLASRPCICPWSSLRPALASFIAVVGVLVVASFLVVADDLAVIPCC
jgi:hypothetical protein